MTSDPKIDSTSTTSAPTTAPTATRPRSTLLWVLLVLGVLANVTATSVLQNVYVSSATGLLVLGCIAALALRARSGRTGA